MKYFISILFCLSACAPIAPRPPAFDHFKAQELIDKGTALLRVGALDDAQASFEMAVQIAGSPEAIDGLGCVEFLRGHIVSAISYFKKSYELKPSAASVSNLALALEVGGDKQNALLLYRRALELDPKHVRARTNYAALLFDLSQVGKVSKERAQKEILHARSLEVHPIIQSNLKTLDEQL